MKNDRIMNIGIPLPFDILLIIQDYLNQNIKKCVKDIDNSRSKWCYNRVNTEIGTWIRYIPWFPITDYDYSRAVIGAVRDVKRIYSL